jgi:hypothetical protein
VLPKPKNATEVTMARLHHTRGQVADVIEQARKVLEQMSSFVKRHFETIPATSVTAHHQSSLSSVQPHFMFVGKNIYIMALRLNYVKICPIFPVLRNDVAIL